MRRPVIRIETFRYDDLNAFRPQPSQQEEYEVLMTEEDHDFICRDSLCSYSLWVDAAPGGRAAGPAPIAERSSAARVRPSDRRGECIVCCGAVKPVRFAHLAGDVAMVWALFSPTSGRHFIRVYRILRALEYVAPAELKGVWTPVSNAFPAHHRLMAMLGWCGLDGDGPLDAIARQWSGMNNLELVAWAEPAGHYRWSDIINATPDGYTIYWKTLS